MASCRLRAAFLCFWPPLPEPSLVRMEDYGGFAGWDAREDTCLQTQHAFLLCVVLLSRREVPREGEKLKVSVQVPGDC